jgi:hypothetical protein
MVRADMIAKHPRIAEKMVKAGVIGYCMGMESPSQGDLGITKKRMSVEAQRSAVRVLRKNHAVAGGTFVCGLSEHTEEEILMFPEYARNLGMINAAFPVATPHAATEFYKGLDEHGLIDDRNWEHYDQMHRVFKHKTLTRKRSEELLTHCLGRFYALDIFLDDIIAAQHRDSTGRKMTFFGAIKHFLDRMNFVMEAGSEYDTIEDGTKMARIFLNAQVNPHTRKRTEAIGIHNVVDLKRILSIMGDQKLGITIRQTGQPFAHYVLKLGPDKVHYLDICKEPHDDVTIGIALDLEDVTGNKASRIKLASRMLKRILKMSKWSSLARGVFAVLVNRIQNNGTRDSSDKMELPEGFFDHLCSSDGWDRQMFQRIKDRNSKHQK